MHEISPWGMPEYTFRSFRFSNRFSESKTSLHIIWKIERLLKLIPKYVCWKTSIKRNDFSQLKFSSKHLHLISQWIEKSVNFLLHELYHLVWNMSKSRIDICFLASWLINFKIQKTIKLIISPEQEMLKPQQAI